MSRVVAERLSYSLKRALVVYPDTPDPIDYATIETDDFTINLSWQPGLEGLEVTLGISPADPEMDLSNVQVLCMHAAELLAEEIAYFESIDLVRYIGSEDVVTWTGFCTLVEHGPYMLDAAYRANHIEETPVLYWPVCNFTDKDWSQFSLDIYEPLPQLRDTKLIYARG